MDFFYIALIFCGVMFSLAGIISAVFFYRNKNTGKVKSSSTKTRYVLSDNSNVFHRPDCPCVKKIDSMNLNTRHSSYSTLISIGCKPCKKCNPK